MVIAGTALHLTIVPTITGDTLTLRYVVNNPTDRDVYLLNRVHDETLQPHPDLVYIELLSAERAVRLYKDLPPIPPNRRPPVPHCPYVTPVRAQQSYVEVVRIRVPVREFSAYGAPPEDVVPADYEELQFALGYYWSVPDMKELEETLPGGTRVLAPRPPPHVKLEDGTLRDRARLKIPVLEPAPQDP